MVRKSRVHAFDSASIWDAVSANGFTVVSRPWFGCTAVPGDADVSAEADANHISASETLRALCGCTCGCCCC